MCGGVGGFNSLCSLPPSAVTSQLITLHDGTAYNSSEIVWNAEPKSLGKPPLPPPPPPQHTHTRFVQCVCAPPPPPLSCCLPAAVYMHPYVLAFTASTVEIRLASNGSLMQTIDVPKPHLFSMKVCAQDIIILMYPQKNTRPCNTVQCNTFMIVHIHDIVHVCQEHTCT